MGFRAARDAFPALAEQTYLNTCSLAALHEDVRAAVEEHLDLWQAQGARAWYETWLDVLDETRARFADLIGARQDEVALAPNVSTAISTVASGLDLEARDEVVLSELDFPTVAYQWMARSGVSTHVVESPDGIQVPPEDLEAAMGPKTAALVTSQVYFTTGAIQDVERLSRAAEDAGALSIVDAYQATGQLPTDVGELGCDVLVTGGLKWLLGGTGIAYLYVSREAQAELEPELAGWFGDAEQFAFDTTRYRPRQDARRFELGTPALPSVYAGNAGLEIVGSWGPKRIRDRQTELVDALYEQLEDEGFDLATPAASRDRAGIVMVEVDDPPGVVDRLAKEGIIVDHRPGRVRISPYVYNTSTEIERVVGAIADAAR